MLPQARPDSPVLSIARRHVFLNRTASGATAVVMVKFVNLLLHFVNEVQISDLEPEIILGLEFIAKSQDADGSWSLQRFPAASAADIGQLQSSTAATGLALLSFLGAGFSPDKENKYQNQVLAGLEYLIKNQQSDGDLYIKQYLEQGTNRTADDSSTKFNAL